MNLSLQKTSQMTEDSSDLKSWLKFVFDQLYEDEKHRKIKQIALKYTGSGNVNLNKYLREQDALETEAERREHTSKFPIPEEEIWELYLSLIDLRVFPKNFKVVIYRGLPMSVIRKLNIGDEFYDAGFSSFTFSITTAIGFSRPDIGTMYPILRLENPIEGVFFSNMGENEFVIGPRAKFLITNIYDSIGIYDDFKNCFVKRAMTIYDIVFIGYQDPK